MKKSKIIAPAAAILVFSSAAAVTGTVAWFTASNLVSVSGLNMKAEAEEGIVIAQEKTAALVDADWKTSVDALHTGSGLAFIPTTTKDLAAWKHANVTTVDNALTGAEYEDFDVTAATVGTPSSVGTGTTATQVKTAKNIFLYNQFYLQAASPADMPTQNIYVKSLTADDAGDPDLALNKALRVAFKIGSEVKVYAPLLGADFTATSYSYAAAQGSQSGTTPNTADYIYTNKTIPAYKTEGTNKLLLEVYCWFEGEDANCKSSNIVATFSNISISFELANVKTA